MKTRTMQLLLPRILRRATPLEMAAEELAKAELSLLAAQTAQEYAESVVSYNKARIARLRAYLATQGEK